eukprot:SAG22_NODE_288_length_12949_cov_163.316265_4_plen_85_part_00
MVELLLKNKASVDAPDKDGWTPLHLAAHNGEAAVAELLLTAGADRTKKSQWGDTWKVTSGLLSGYTPAQTAKSQGHHALAARLG